MHFFFEGNKESLLLRCSANIRLISYCRQNKEIKWHATEKLMRFLFKTKENKARTQNMKSQEVVWDTKEKEKVGKVFENSFYGIS